MINNMLMTRITSNRARHAMLSSITNLGHILLYVYISQGKKNLNMIIMPLYHNSNAIMTLTLQCSHKTRLRSGLQSFVFSAAQIFSAPRRSKSRAECGIAAYLLSMTSFHEGGLAKEPVAYAYSELHLEWMPKCTQRFDFKRPC